MQPKFFKSQQSFRNWLAQYHANRSELLLGFYKKSAVKDGIRYPQALDEALCFGWIDGVRKSLDEVSYTVRFTPRKPRSIWSLVNVRHVERLQKSGQMQAPGLAAFALRQSHRTGIYAFENRPKEFSDVFLKQFKRHKKAWEFFEDQSPSYKRTAIYRVMSARKPETQIRRLQQLIESSAKGKRDSAISENPKTRIKTKNR